MTNQGEKTFEKSFEPISRNAAVPRRVARRLARALREAQIRSDLFAITRAARAPTEREFLRSVVEKLRGAKWTRRITEARIQRLASPARAEHELRFLVRVVDALGGRLSIRFHRDTPDYDLRLLRKQVGLSETEVGRMTGTSQQRVSALEFGLSNAGEWYRPGHSDYLGDLRKVAHVLGYRVVVQIQRSTAGR